ncbi:MAG: manganese efflux pump MntP family protein [Bacteroidales bacterium]|jgi:putative Mn2+ efflux pump MntP|nr:manganese efflux pump MntP family protein [Bacteroidales bacterium]
MSFLEIIFIAVGLSMDAFAVSITLGLSTKKLNPSKVIIPSLYFGFFQSIMPLIGYFAGIYFANKIQDADHWVAFALLVLIGGKMIKDSFSKEKKEENFGFRKMLTLAIATSIDALAIGITFAFFEVNIYTAILAIGVITFFISMGGVVIGNTFGIKLKSKAGLIGGAVLILIGTKILIEHLFF